MTTSYPQYYAVNDRPVKFVKLPDGSVDCLVFDASSGAFVPDRSYFSRVSDVGVGKDVDQFTEQQVRQLVVDLRRPIVARHLTSSLAWEGTGDGEFPYRTTVNGRTFTIRINDFPAEPMYTLIAEGDELADLDDWPPAWSRPGAPAAAASSEATQLRALAERLTSVATGSEAEIRAALGVPTDPPPYGATYFRFRAAQLSLANVELQYAPARLERRELDAVFGAAEELPRTRPTSSVLAYTVRVPGAPAKVTVFARFFDEPQLSTKTHSLQFRIDPP